MENFKSHILVIDDDEGIRSLLKQFLKLYVQQSRKEISPKLISLSAVLFHIKVDYILSIVVQESFGESLPVW